MHALTWNHLLGHRAFLVETRFVPTLPQDRQRFDAFAREHEAVLRATALRLCRDVSDARDLVQDTFERALRGFHTWRPDTDGRAWLMRILHNLFIDRCRAQASRDRTVPWGQPSSRAASAVVRPPR